MEPPYWLIGFCNVGDKLSWWDIVFRTRPGYRHVFAIGYEPVNKIWLLAEWTSMGATVRVVKDEDAYNFISHCYKTGGVVYKIPRSLGADLGMVKFGYCVTFIKQLLGFKLPFVLTPHQLSCAVKKMGYTPILSEAFTDRTANG